MQHLLQLVTIQVPHAVKIPCREPLSLKNLLRLRTTYRIQQQALKLIVAQPVFSTRTDVIVPVPELLRHLVTTYALQQPSAVFHRRPLQHTANRHMEHDRIVVLQYRRIQDTRLTQTNPLLDTRVRDHPLRLHLRQTVVVICRHTDRIACPAPVQRLTPVTHLGYRTYIHHLRLIVLTLRQHRLRHVLCCRQISLTRRLRTIVRLRRHHAAYVQHDIRTRHTLQHILILRQITPYHLQVTVLRHQRRQQGHVLLTLPRQDLQRITLRVTQYLSHARITHRTGRTGQKNSRLLRLLHRCTSYFFLLFFNKN